MGKFYTTTQNSLYIYVTEDDELIPPRDLPTLLGLYEAKHPWKWTNKIAIMHKLPEESLQQAAAILEIHDYERRNADESSLEHYFITQDPTYLPPDEPPLLKTLRKLEEAFKNGRLSEDIYKQQKEVIERKLLGLKPDPDLFTTTTERCYQKLNTELRPGLKLVYVEIDRLRKDVCTEIGINEDDFDDLLKAMLRKFVGKMELAGAPPTMPSPTTRSAHITREGRGLELDGKLYYYIAIFEPSLSP
ncbi:MAG: hypothetical protein AOA65_1636 [Candidatus Bathyarchaeota archaeon BA1]|nr:MAG: hypothetical protein AOA65_1636 [Candidatus Bathyarchaeota archaeon BA1]